MPDDVLSIAADTVALPARFAATRLSSSQTVVITDVETGRVAAVPAAAFGIIRAALADLFGADQRLRLVKPTSISRSSGQRVLDALRDAFPPGTWVKVAEAKPVIAAALGPMRSAGAKNLENYWRTALALAGSTIERDGHYWRFSG